MNNALQSIRVGIFFVLGLSLLYIVYEMLGQKDFSKKEGYHLTARFDDIKLTAAGDEVRMAGVKIGTVNETRLVEGQAEVVLRIIDEYKIPEDSTVMIAAAGLLGRNYITIAYGNEAAGFLADGNSITSKKSFDMNDMIAKVGQIGEKIEVATAKFSDFLGGDEEGSKNPFANINALIDENREKIESMINNIHEVTEKINRGDGTLGKLINDDSTFNELQTAMSDIKKTASSISTTFEEAKTLIDDIKKGEGTLGKLIYDDSLAKQIDDVTINFRSFSEKLNSDEGTIGLLLKDDTIYRDLKSLLNKAERTVDGVSDSGPISAVGVAANALF